MMRRRGKRRSKGKKKKRNTESLASLNKNPGCWIKTGIPRSRRIGLALGVEKWAKVLSKV